MKKIKILPLVLGGTLLLTSLVGCGSKTDSAKVTTQSGSNVNPTGYPIFKDKQTFKVMAVQSSALCSDWNENSFFKAMEAKTNMHIEFDLIESSAWSEKKNLAFASGELPDFFFKAGISAQEETTYSDQGLIVYIDEYIKKSAPNMTKLFNEMPDFRKQITLSNGHITSFPSYYDKLTPTIATNFHINSAWLKKLGLAEPANINELTNVLKAFKEKDPNGNGKNDEIPLTLSGLSDVKQFTYFFGIGYGENGMFANDDKKVYYAPMMPEFKELVIYLRKLYQEGLLDNEFLTHNSNQIKAKGTDNRLGLVRFGTVATYGNDRANDWMMMKPIKAANGKQFLPRNSGIGRGTNTITNVNKYPEETVRWFDYLYSQEGSQLTWMGIENQDYKKTGDTWNWILPQGVDEGTHRGRATIQPSGGWAGLCPELWFKTSDRLEKANIESRERVKEYARLAYPMIYLSVEESKKVSSLATDIGGYVDQTIAKAITGNISIESEWDNYIAQLKKMNVDQLVSIYQKQYDDYLKK